MSSIAICLVTYNQEKYIAQAIQSVLMQTVNVPFKLFIGEDLSTDNTLKICREYQQKYPDKIELFASTKNKGLVQNTLDLLKSITDNKYEYIAMLDGDDYWDNSNKLQMQYDFLSKNKQYGLVHTSNSILWDNQILEKQIKNNPLEGYVFDRIENFNIANCTVMFKASLLNYINFDEFNKQGFMSLDYVMYAIFSKYLKFGYLKEYTAVWRRGHSSVSNTNSKEKDIAYIENDINMWRYLGSLFPERFNFTEDTAELWRNFRVFNIAFKYQDYALANRIVKSKSLTHRNSTSFKLKKIAAKNKIFFKLWCSLRN